MEAVGSEPCKLVAYLRVSTSEQGRSGLGAQEAAVAAYVRSSGCRLLKTYKEVESGRKSERVALTAAIAHAKRAGATLVIAKLDRLSRNVAFIANLKEQGVDFIACDNPQANRLTVHILAAVAEQEAKMISDRTKAALTAYKARGGTLGTPNLTPEARAKGAARAAQVNPQKRIKFYRQHEDTARTMREQGMSYAAIAQALNDEGSVTRRGKAWNAMQVHRLLNQSLAG
jgi:DNA invertase Pin-like site-specific DNA recombinase